MPFVLDRNHVLDAYPDAAANMPRSPLWVWQVNCVKRGNVKMGNLIHELICETLELCESKENLRRKKL